MYLLSILELSPVVVHMAALDFFPLPLRSDQVMMLTHT